MFVCAQTLHGRSTIGDVFAPKQSWSNMVQVFREGAEQHSNLPKMLKSKVWQEVVAELKVKGGQPTYRGDALCTSTGPCTLPDGISEGSGIS